MGATHSTPQYVRGGSSTPKSQMTLGDIMQLANALVSDKQLWKQMTPSQVKFMTLICHVSPSLPLPAAVKACQQYVNKMTSKKADTSLPLISFLKTNKQAQNIVTMFLNDMPVRAMSGGADEDEAMCEICYMSFESTADQPRATQLSCRHNGDYHSACLQTWFDSKTVRSCECPKCKQACVGVPPNARHVHVDMNLPEEGEIEQLINRMVEAARQHDAQMAQLHEEEMAQMRQHEQRMAQLDEERMARLHEERMAQLARETAQANAQMAQANAEFARRAALQQAARLRLVEQRAAELARLEWARERARGQNIEVIQYMFMMIMMIGCYFLAYPQ